MVRLIIGLSQWGAGSHFSEGTLERPEFDAVSRTNDDLFVVPHAYVGRLGRRRVLFRQRGGRFEWLVRSVCELRDQDFVDLAIHWSNG